MIFQAKMPNILQPLKCEDMLLFVCLIVLETKHLLDLDCWFDKTSHLKMSPWALGNYDGYISVLADITRPND